MYVCIQTFRCYVTSNITTFMSYLHSMTYERSLYIAVIRHEGNNHDFYMHLHAIKVSEESGIQHNAYLANYFFIHASCRFCNEACSPHASISCFGILIFHCRAMYDTQNRCVLLFKMWKSDTKSCHCYINLHMLGNYTMHSQCKQVLLIRP